MANDGETIAEYMVKYNPSYQLELCQNRDDCFYGDYPTLGLLKSAYGPKAPTMWLLPQLTNLSEFCGCKNKLTDDALEECASILANLYGYMKTSEFMLFFYQFKAGRYGKFYGSVDPMVITTSMITFADERIAAIDRAEQLERERKDAESRKNAITYEEYCRRSGKPIKHNPLKKLQDEAK